MDAQSSERERGAGGELSSQMRADNPPLILLLLPPYSQGHINETTVPLSLSFKGFLFFLRLAGYCLKERCFSLKAGSGETSRCSASGRCI